METLRTRYTLLERVKSSDDQAWQDFVDIYRQYMCCLCYKMGLHEEHVDEIVQRVTVKLWQKMPEYKKLDGGKFRNWLAKVTVNEAKDYLKQGSTRSKHEKSYAEHEALKGFEKHAEIELLAEREWHVYAVNRALDQLKDRFNEKTLNIYKNLMDGKPISEVSKEHEIAESSIRVYKKRVTEALAHEIRHLESLLS
jgi:RNA polymerase sigma-70 factor (ECF subfamily)